MVILFDFPFDYVKIATENGQLEWVFPFHNYVNVYQRVKEPMFLQSFGGVLKHDGSWKMHSIRGFLQVLRSQPSYTQGQIEQQIANNNLGAVDQMDHSQSVIYDR